MLDPVAHERIIANIEQICTVAGIQTHFLYESMLKVCGAEELAWVRHYWKNKREGRGLLLHGVTRPDTRCQAMAAALVRNYIDARVIPANTLIELVQDGNPPFNSVVLVPNLYVSVTKIPGWRSQILYEILQQRAARGKVSVVYVENMKGCAHAFGEPFRDFLDRFQEVTE